MSGTAKQYAAQEAEKATHEEKRKTALRLYLTGKLTKTEIADATGLELAEIEEIIRGTAS